MIRLALAAAVTGIVFGCWHLGTAIEWFLNSKYCFPIVRRVAYFVLALAMVSGLMRVLL